MSDDCRIKWKKRDMEGYMMPDVENSKDLISVLWSEAINDSTME